jgi:hypothetical protein
MADEQVMFLIRDAVMIALEPADTFDRRVREALGTRWTSVESVACSGDAYERMDRAGLLKHNDSPASYAGKQMFIQHADNTDTDVLAGRRADTHPDDDYMEDYGAEDERGISHG